jgi:hypothetical protein
MRTSRGLPGLLVALLLLVPLSQAVGEEPTALSAEVASPVVPKDLMLVSDNSGSMKQNDLKFLMREVVSSFANQLPGD